MTELNILTSKERQQFDNPPLFKKADRPFYFRLSPGERKTVSRITNRIGQVGYVLLLGYFKATGRFFHPSRFKIRDIDYVCRHFKTPSIDSFEDYKSTSRERHQKRILQDAGWASFSAQVHNQLFEKTNWLVSKQFHPNKLFHALRDYCWKQQWEIPAYHVLADLITTGYQHHETHLLDTLDSLTTPDTLRQIKRWHAFRFGEFTFSDLSRIDQSLKPKNIRKHAQIIHKIRLHFDRLDPLLTKLRMSDQSIEYHSNWVRKARTLQLSQFERKSKGSLYLLCYLRNQFYLRQDTLADVFLKCVNSAVSRTNKEVKKWQQQTEKEHYQAMEQLAKSHKTARQLLSEIELIVKGIGATPNEKYYKIENLINEQEDNQLFQSNEQSTDIEQYFDKSKQNDILFQAMESLSHRLQLRVSLVVKTIQFDERSSDKTLVHAIDYFVQTNGKLAESAPTAFLSTHEKKVIFESGRLNIPLYKFLLFSYMAKGIKAGKLNLKYSYRYRAIQDYLIDKKTWEENRDELLLSAEMSQYKDCDKYLEELKTRLDEKYFDTNQHYLSGENPHLTLNSESRVHIKSPRTEYHEAEIISSTLSQSGFTPILQVLRDIDKVCDFKRHFTHFSVKHSKLRPTPEVIYAGMLGKGCNIGIAKIANISKGINENNLRTTVNWCFDLNNVQTANRSVVDSISRLSLSNAYKYSEDTIHSSSDGRKVNVAVESLNASYSFKYFGKDKGVTMYTFIDERQALYHSTVISASDREAVYVVDGLLNNQVSEKRIHSTDTHGFTETVFAATHFVETSFAPRFRKIGNQTIYGFSAKSTYKKRGYKILPSRTINHRLIRSQWDEILRFMATIKLNHATASQLFKRLSSYAIDHPLYRALKEFGRIIKSQYILTYYDDLELRQRIQKQLNRVELANKFSHAVFFDNSQEFREAQKEDQELTTACKVLIQNAIILWNYLYLSNVIVKIKDKEERKELIAAILGGSVITWKHINLRGEYDFTKRAANESEFDLKRILALKVNKIQN